MEIKQNPFSLYDFLGYFVPGALCLYAGFLAVQIWFPRAEIATSLAGIFRPSQLEFYLPFVLVAYLLGHTLSFIPSITVERYSVWRLGYPSRYLLGNARPRYFEVQRPVLTRKLVRFAVAIAIFPITVLDSFFDRVLRLNDLFARPLDNVLLRHFPILVKRLLRSRGLPEPSSDEIATGQSEYFRLLYHHNVEHAPAHLPKMQNYVALYGFCRTIALLFVLLFWLSAYAAVAHISSQPQSVIIAVASAIGAYAFFLDFLKFYRRFSQEVIMAFAITLFDEGRGASRPTTR